jgi:teichuronic acid biosynthesis glycosyltransferase TuaC
VTRVALVLSYFPTELRPHAGVQFYHMAGALAKLAEVGVFVVLPEYPKAGLLKPRRFAHKESDRPLPLAGVPVRHVTYPAFPLVSRVLNGRTCGKRLLPELRTFRPDVVVAYQVYPEAYAALYAAEKLGVPCVAGAIGSDVRRIPRFVGPLVASTLQRASHVVTVCEELSERARRMGVPPAKVSTIMNGCDPEIFHRRDRDPARAALGVAPETRLVVFTGNLVEVKGLPDLIRALSILDTAGMPVDATLIGSGPLEPRLRELAGSLGLASRIRFTGSLAPREVAQWLGAADVFCLPSLSEGSPNVMMEALRCGRPVVASNVGGIPELLTPMSGILTPPSNPTALADALRQAFTRHWDEAAIARISRRTWSDMAGETYDVCRKVLNQGLPAGQPVSRTA